MVTGSENKAIKRRDIASIIEFPINFFYNIYMIPLHYYMIV